MLQRLPTAVAQVKAGNNSENLSYEIRQIVYSLYQSKEIAKKVYNNIISQQNKIKFSGVVLKEVALKYKNGQYIYELRKP